MWDEAMFCRESMKEHFVIPIIGQKFAVLIIISSPPAYYNWCSAMIDTINPVTKEPLFQVLRHTLICDRCAQTRKNPELCPHKLHELPPWKASNNLKISKELFRSNTRMFAAEMMGAMLQNGGMEFPLDGINALGERARVPWNAGFPRPEFVFVSCDPNAGGDDQTAITMFTQVHGTYYVVGMDTYRTTANDIDEMLETMMDRLAEIPLFQNAWKIYAGERNTGHVSGRHAVIMSKPKYGGRTYSLCERPDRNYGVWTSHERKKLFADHMREALQMDQIVFLKDFVVYNKENKPLEEYRASVVETLCSQLRLIVPDGKGAWSGKIDALGKRVRGQCDDLAMATMMGVYYMKMFLMRRLSFVDYSHFENTSVAIRGDFTVLQPHH